MIISNIGTLQSARFTPSECPALAIKSSQIIFTRAFVGAYHVNDALFKASFFRITHGSDVVGLLPPHSFEFVHTGTEVAIAFSCNV